MRKIALFMVLVVIIAVAGVKLSPARSATRAVSCWRACPTVRLCDNRFSEDAGSSLWGAINAQDRLKTEIDRAQSEMADLGLKLSDLRTVALVFPGSGLNNPTLALAGGFEQNDLLARLRSSGKVRLTSGKYKDFDIYQARPIAAAVPSRNCPARRAPRPAETPRNDGTSLSFTTEHPCDRQSGRGSYRD